MIKGKSSKIIFLITIFIGMYSTFAFSQEAKVPENIFSALIVKVLGYDRSLSQRVEGDLNIGLIYLTGDKESREQAQEMKSNLDKLPAGFRLKGFKVLSRVIGYDVKNKNKKNLLERAIKESNIEAVCVIDDDLSLINSVTEISRRLKLNTFTDKSNALANGIAFAVLLKDSKPKLFINFRTSIDEGSDYSARLLSLCEKVER